MSKHDERMKRGTKLLKKMGRDGLLASQQEDYPDLYDLTVANLFGDIWTRPHLSLRDRQLITLAAGVALARTSGNHSHYHSALHIGITREEIIELIIHVGHYAGWPTIGLAMRQLKKVIAAGGSGKNQKNSPAKMRKLAAAWEK
jgi:4-carboxymuconolactone decarboxylase